MRLGERLFHGEYRVQLGQGNATSVKYNFRPDSVDCTRPGRLSGEGEEHTLERPAGGDQVALFQGPKQAGREDEYLLLFDADRQTFTLEKVAHVLRLSQTRQGSKQTTTKTKTKTRGTARTSRAKPALKDKEEEDSDVEEFANMLEEELERKGEEERGHVRGGQGEETSSEEE